MIYDEIIFLGYDANGSPVYDYLFDPRKDLIHHNED